MAVPNAQQLLDTHSGKHEDSTFDYIVVGGGTAGLTLAHRLVTESSATVAVIEAGGFDDIDNEGKLAVPALAITGLGKDPSPELINPKIDWLQKTEPQPQLEGKSLFWANGKVLGGNSTRNFMVYHRATVGTYDKWATDVGDDSYTWNNLQPFFKKSCSFTPPDNSRRQHDTPARFDANAFDKAGGPLHISTADRYIPSMAQPFSQALQANGMPAIDGLQSGTLIGVSESALSMQPDLQVRSSFETSFLRDALQKTNRLTLFTHTLAKRILFDTNKRATGVQVHSEDDGKIYTLSCTREVLLTAGALRTPQLLMVSGIGPPDMLAKHSIAVIHAQPAIGQNMEDHCVFNLTFEVSEPTHSKLSDPQTMASAYSQFHTDHTGPLTSNVSILAFEKLPAAHRDALSPATRAALASYPADWPHLEHMYLDAYFGDQNDFTAGVPADGRMYAAHVLVSATPQSRGSVTIASADTAVRPLVDPAWLRAPADQELAVRAVRRAREIAAYPSMRDKIVGDEVWPGPHVQSDEEVLDAVKRTAAGIYHPCATCRMGKEGDAGAVVDARARVRGVAGLRVVDAAALPFVPPGHPMATVYVLAEKIAFDVMQDWAMLG